MSELVRANRISVQPNTDREGFVATFYRTHKKLGTVDSIDTGWEPMNGLNNAAQRELFRVYSIEHCDQWGYQYDAQDRRTDSNQLPKTYADDDILGDTAIKLIHGDIVDWVNKTNTDIKDAVVGLEEITCDGIDEVFITNSGKEVKPHYNNGNWAWAKIQLCITLNWVIDGDTIPTYISMTAELVSGQLKKPTKIGDGGYNYTSFKAEAMVDISDKLPTEDKAKKETVQEAPKNEQPVEEQPIQYPDWVVLKKDGTPNKKSMERLQAEGLIK